MHNILEDHGTTVGTALRPKGLTMRCAKDNEGPLGWHPVGVAGVDLAEEDVQHGGKEEPQQQQVGKVQQAAADHAQHIGPNGSRGAQVQQQRQPACHGAAQQREQHGSG